MVDAESGSDMPSWEVAAWLAEASTILHLGGRLVTWGTIAGLWREEGLSWATPAVVRRMGHRAGLDLISVQLMGVDL